MKKLIIAYLLILALSLTGCSVVSQGGVTADSTSTTQPKTTEPAVSAEKIITLFGNSLTASVPAFCTRYAKLLQKNIEVKASTQQGQALGFQVENIKSGKYDKSIHESDVIVLQDVGRISEAESVPLIAYVVQNITDFKSIFGTDKKYYVVVTEFLLPYIDQVKEKHPDVGYIYSGLVHKILTENGTFENKDLTIADQWHSNPLYQYMTMCVSYHTIFNIPLEEFRYESEKLVEMPGSTEAEKQANVAAIKDAINAAIRESGK